MPDHTVQSDYAMDLTGRVEMHEGSYVSFCNELPLVGVGATSADAMGSLLLCVKEFIRASDELGIVDEVMRDYGFVARNASVNLTSGNFALNLPNVALSIPADPGGRG